jgi:hypothetical protein
LRRISAVSGDSDEFEASYPRFALGVEDVGRRLPGLGRCWEGSIYTGEDASELMSPPITARERGVWSMRMVYEKFDKYTESNDAER